VDASRRSAAGSSAQEAPEFELGDDGSGVRRPRRDGKRPLDRDIMLRGRSIQGRPDRLISGPEHAHETESVTPRYASGSQMVTSALREIRWPRPAEPQLSAGSLPANDLRRRFVPEGPFSPMCPT